MAISYDPNTVNCNCFSQNKVLSPFETRF
jgi:hypothetical protein